MYHFVPYEADSDYPCLVFKSRITNDSDEIYVLDYFCNDVSASSPIEYEILSDMIGVVERWNTEPSSLIHFIENTASIEVIVDDVEFYEWHDLSWQKRDWWAK